MSGFQLFQRKMELDGFCSRQSSSFQQQPQLFNFASIPLVWPDETLPGKTRDSGSKCIPETDGPLEKKKRKKTTEPFPGSDVDCGGEIIAAPLLEIH